MSDSWQDLINVDDLETNDVTPVSFESKMLAVYDAKHGIYVSDARCTHAGADLCDGYFDGENIECPLHQGLFDIKTGQAKAAPATTPLTVYPARIHNGVVQICFPGKPKAT